MVILANDKKILHDLFLDISEYLDTQLKLEVKGNHQVFPIAARGLDFVGYRFYHGYVRIRKSIKQNFARSMANHGMVKSYSPYKGWLMYCKSKHLIKKVMFPYTFDIIDYY